MQSEAMGTVETVEQNARSTRSDFAGIAIGNQEHLTASRRTHQQITGFAHCHEARVGNPCRPDLDVEAIR